MLQPQIDDQIYQEQPQIVRNEWPQMPQQQQQQQHPQQSPPQAPIIVQTIPKQGNSIWPEKLPKQVDEKIANHKKEPKEQSEYSEEYAEGDEGQSEGEDVTTTEAPKKVF
jgi:hypothetical protein